MYWKGHDTPMWRQRRDMGSSAYMATAYRAKENGSAQIYYSGTTHNGDLAGRPHGRPLFGHGHGDPLTHGPYQHGPPIWVEGNSVPTRTDNHYGLWGADFRPSPGMEVVICTDGSTYPGLPSGAGFVFVDDDVKANEYTPKGTSWRSTTRSGWTRLRPSQRSGEPLLTS